MADDGINLDDPGLGARLLKDPMGLPLEVFETYVAHNHNQDHPESRLINDWAMYTDWRSISYLSPIKPQDAVDQVAPRIGKIVSDLRRPRPAVDKASQLLAEINEILFRASSSYRRPRGQPALMRPYAVRAWVIRKFNPGLTWAKITDLLFLLDGKCPRPISEGKAKLKARTCNVAHHDNDSQCVEALHEAVERLLTAMKLEGIPT